MMTRRTASQALMVLTALAFAGCDSQGPATGPDVEPPADAPLSAVGFDGIMPQWMIEMSKSTGMRTSAPEAPEGLTFFTDRALFEEGCNVPVEDFEDGQDIVDGVVFAPPLDENTDNAYFSPGDILPGISITTDNAFDYMGTAQDLGYLPPGVHNHVSKVVVANWPSESLILNLTGGGATRVGGDLIRPFFGVGPTVEIEIFGSGGSLGSTVASSAPEGIFWGVESDEPITQIVLFDGSFFGIIGMDNISFCSSNQPPDVSNAAPSIGELWPPNHKMVEVSILGVTDPDDDPVTITITGITDNEGSAPSEMGGIGTSIALLRANRDGFGLGRVYTIEFTASDGNGGETDGAVSVLVPHDQGRGNARGRH